MTLCKIVLTFIFAFKKAVIKNTFEIIADEKRIKQLSLQCGDRAWLWNKPFSNEVLIFCKGFGIAAEKLTILSDSNLYKIVENGQSEVVVFNIEGDKVVMKFS